MPSGIADPAALLPIDPFFDPGDDAPAPSAPQGDEVILIPAPGLGRSGPAAREIPSYPPLVLVVGAPEARKIFALASFPEPELAGFEKIAHGLARFFHVSWSPDLKVLSVDQFATAAQEGNPFGIHSDGKGNWVYPPENREEIVAHLHPWRVRRHEAGILELKVSGTVDRVLLFPEAAPASSEPPPIALDYTPLRPAVPQEKPIVFYHEDATLGGVGGTKPGVAQWVHAMRGLGYNIIYAGSMREFGRVVRAARPDIVLVSAVENLLPYAQGAYFAAKEANPSAITVLGGFAAIPEFARHYDIVMRGESEIALPMVLSRLLAMLSEGAVGQVEPAGWDTMVAGLDDYLSAAGRPGWVTEFVTGQRYYPPILSEAAAAELTSLAGTRYVSASDGARFAVGVPIGYDTRTQEPRIFVRSLGGTVSAEPEPLGPRLSGALARWRGLRSGEAFPLNPRLFALATEPFPVTPDEIDALYARYPSDADSGRYVGSEGEEFVVPFPDAALYVQRGCRGDARCVFCSIPQKAEGRRASIDQVVRVMRQAAIDGMARFVFNDDNFTLDRNWVGEFLKRVEAEGLHRRIRIHVQTRIDMLPIDLLRQMRHLGIEFSTGVETLDPVRAERLGKVNAGSGGRYIAKAQEAMRRLAATQVPEDDYYIIAVAHGDSLVDVARDTLAQLEMMDELWRDHGYLPAFRYSLTQAPYYGDQITASLSGLPHAQPGSIPIGDSPWVTLGEIRGVFDPYGLAVVDGALHATGIFHPMRFVWPEPIREFIASFGGNTSGPHIGDIIEGLEFALARSQELDAADRAALQQLLQQIRARYWEVKRDVGPENARLLMSRDEQALERKANDPFGRDGGPTIRF